MRLSIITINYNNRDGLQKTIDSVITQTWKSFEWILIDGGSTDGSKELVEKYKDAFSFSCSEPDKGIYNAMNKGISHAKGDYLLFLNSGDVFYDDLVLEHVNDIEFNCDIVSGQMVRMDNGRLLRKYDEDILMQLFERTINHQATFIRRELLLENPYDEDLRIVSDWKFWIESIIIKNASYQVLDLFISKQDMTGISYSDKHKPLHLAERKTVLDSCFPQRVLDTLQNYSSLRHTSVVRNMDYLEKKHPRVFWAVKKVISCASLLCHQIAKDYD